MKGRTFLGIELPHLPEQITPKRTLGYEKLSETERIIADSISVNEQRSVLAVELAQAALNIILVLRKIMALVIVVVLILEGPRIYRIATDYLGVRELGLLVK